MTDYLSNIKYFLSKFFFFIIKTAVPILALRNSSLFLVALIFPVKTEKLNENIYFYRSSAWMLEYTIFINVVYLRKLSVTTIN